MEPAEPDHIIPELGFDPERKALIEPASLIKDRDLPERCVVTFFREVLKTCRERLSLEPLPPFRSEMGDVPVYQATYEGETLAISQAAVGAPLAGGQLEELIARGGRRFVACGAAGVLDRSLQTGHVIVPTSAVRDEGTSYHYMPPGQDARPSPAALASITRVLDRRGIDYVAGMTWTTDAFYRETPNRIASRKRQGCITVEMEAAAYFAVAEFRQVALAQLLYAGDDVSGKEWDSRGYQRNVSARERLLWLAVEACLDIVPDT